MTEQKGKNIFQAAMDSLSNRDEKAAVEAALKRGEEMEKKLAEAQERASQTQIKLAAAEKRAAGAEAKLAETQKKMEEMEKKFADLETRSGELQRKYNSVSADLQKMVSEKQSQQFAERGKAEAAARIIAEHTLTPDESLSHLALKYYGSAYEPYWRVIYEANKELIGDNPGRVRPGMVIKIPVLPEELKKK